ncbi:MAG: outer membrane beta-barrel protein [Myxococcales bacterium]|nr:outer membrane beta-barrel protein [Myxococcales bacterium]
MRVHHRVWVIVARLVIMVTLVAASLPLSRSANADGIEAGGLTLRPVVRVESGYDSNVFYNSSSASPRSSLRLDIVPSLKVTTSAPRAVDLRSGLNFRWEQYLTRSSEAIRQVSGAEADLHLEARFNPLGLWSVRPDVDFRRTNNPASSATGDAYRNNVVGGGVELALHPGGALRTSRMGISGTVRPYFRSWSFPQRPDINRNAVGGELNLYWNFLPRTAVFVQSGVLRSIYTEDAVITNVTNAEGAGSTFATPNLNSTPVRFVGGLRGLLGLRFSALLSAGYARSNYEGGPSINPFIANTQLRYNLNDRSSVYVAYVRDFSDSNLGNYLRFDRFVAGLDGKFGKISSTVEAYLQLSDYARVDDQLVNGQPLFGTSERRDTLVGALVDGTYSITQWMALGANYRLELRDSNFGALSFISAETAGNQVSASYVRHAVNFVVQFSY